MISQERYDELKSYFWNESNDEDTEFWREFLTEEERKLVDEWDAEYAKSFYKLCDEITKANKKHHTF